MAFDVSALSSYTDEQVAKYLYQTVKEGDTLKLIPNRQTGIKSGEKIKIITTTGVWQAGGSCGFNASGDTAFSERTLTVGKVKINLEWCPKTLESKYTQLRLEKGSVYETAQFQEEIVAQLQNKDSYNVENVIWNGDTTSGDAYLARFDGYRKIIKAGTGVLTTSTSGSTAWSSANSRTVVQSFVTKLTASLPQKLASKSLRLFIGIAEYYALKQKYITDNLFHITGDEGVLHVEGTDIPIVPVSGLSGKAELYLMELDNMYVGTDMENEEEKFEFWYSQDDDVVRYKKEFKLGVQVAFPSEIIYYVSA